MFGSYVLTPNQQNLILFVLVDSSNEEVTGLGTGFTLELSKAGAAFASSAGTKAEVGDGWYSYLATAGEADTIGPLALKINHASIVQQNIPCVVSELTINSVEFTYTVTDSVSGLPIEGVEVWFAIPPGNSKVAEYCVTDSFGIARVPVSGLLPRLDPGTYNVYRQKAGYSFNDPDIESVS